MGLPAAAVLFCGVCARFGWYCFTLLPTPVSCLLQDAIRNGFHDVADELEAHGATVPVDHMMKFMRDALYARNVEVRRRGWWVVPVCVGKDKCSRCRRVPQDVFRAFPLPPPAPPPPPSPLFPAPAPQAVSQLIDRRNVPVDAVDGEGRTGVRFRVPCRVCALR